MPEESSFQDVGGQRPAPTFVPGRRGVVSLGLMGGSFAKAFAAQHGSYICRELLHARARHDRDRGG